MNGNNSSSMKKRKANDGRATADGTHDVHRGNTNDGGGFLSSWFGYFSGQRDSASSGSPNNDHFFQQSLSKMDRMEQIMMRMEEKLATVSSLESRCEQLEAKCSSLQNMLETTTQSTKEHIDSLHLHLDQKCNSLESRLETKVDSVHEKVERSLKFHEYNKMIVKNQNWEYSAVVHSKGDWMLNGYDEDEAEYLAHTAEELRDITIRLRRGESPHEEMYVDEDKGIYLEKMTGSFTEHTNEELLSHWKEFAAALKQFSPAINLLPDDCVSFFSLRNVQLNRDAMLLIKEALIGKPFQKLAFINNANEDDFRPGGMYLDAILEIVESNKHLRKLVIGRNQIGREHIERLCSDVHTHALVELNLFNSFEPGIGDKMLTSLLTIDDLKLEKLDMSWNNITSDVSMLLSDYLEANPRLKELDLEHNNLNDRDAALIAIALRSNSTLRSLILFGNRLTDVGGICLRLVLYDESSLTATADSNHLCTVDLGWNGDDDYNSHDQGHINRGRKIYSILSTRNKTMSNVQHFGDIDVKLLPNMLEAVQKYATNVNFLKVKPLSIVYEVMRKWGVGNFET